MGADTRDRLLDQAERIFAAKGIEAASIRDIVSAAGANLGAITYHFGTKGALVQAVIDRRLRPLDDERLRLLKAAERESAPAPARLESVLHAAITPTLRLMWEHPPFMRIVGRILSDPGARFQRRAEAKPLFRRFMRAIRSAVPEVPREALVWRIHFLRGSLIHTWTSVEQLQAIAPGPGQPADSAMIAKRLIEFAAAGLRAPVRGVPAHPRARNRRRTER
jgi:AcrR family transcriptional regulator